MSVLAPRPSPAAAPHRRLRVAHEKSEVDLAAAERAVADLLVALGRDPTAEHLADTPRRVARTYADLLTRDLQAQERLTTQVADWLQRQLAPKGVGVVLEAEHLCMSLRGVRAAGARTVTSALQGVLREDARSRQEFFALTGVHN